MGFQRDLPPNPSKSWAQFQASENQGPLKGLVHSFGLQAFHAAPNNLTLGMQLGTGVSCCVRPLELPFAALVPQLGLGADVAFVWRIVGSTRGWRQLFKPNNCLVPRRKLSHWSDLAYLCFYIQAPNQTPTLPVIQWRLGFHVCRFFPLETNCPPQGLVRPSGHPGGVLPLCLAGSLGLGAGGGGWKAEMDRHTSHTFYRAAVLGEPCRLFCRESKRKPPIPGFAYFESQPICKIGMSTWRVSSASKRGAQLF